MSRLADEEKDKKIHEENHKHLMEKKEEERRKYNSPDHIFLRLSTSKDKDALEKMRDLLAENPGLVDSRDDVQNTALHLAGSHGLLNLCKLLVEKGAKVGAVNLQGNTPLHSACFFNRIPVIELLLKEGASNSAVNVKKRKPLDLLEADPEVKRRLAAMESMNILTVSETSYIFHPTPMIIGDSCNNIYSFTKLFF
jgi:ankyrin repeat protein